MTLSEIQPLFYPEAGLALGRGGAALGITASFAGDVEGITMLSKEQPTANIEITMDASVPDGRYPMIVTGCNGAQEQNLALQLVMGDPMERRYLLKILKQTDAAAAPQIEPRAGLGVFSRPGISESVGS